MMKRLMTFLSAWILSVALLWGGGSAWALSFSTSTATINLDALSFTFNGAPIEIVFTDVFSDTLVSAFADGPSAFASALAESSESRVLESVNAAAGEDSIAIAQAFALRRGVFESPGEGLLTVSVPFFAFSIASAGTLEDTAIASFLALIGLGQGLTVDTDSEEGLVAALGGGSDFVFSSGFLSASILFEEGRTGFFEAQVANFAVASSGTLNGRNNNVVPEPTSLLLLGSGLVGFGVWRRRQGGGGPSKVL